MYGFKLDVNGARRLVLHNNATFLVRFQQAFLSGLIWVIENPHQGLFESQQANYECILEIATSYLGQFGGVWSTWHFEANVRAPYWHFADLQVNEASPQTQDI